MRKVIFYKFIKKKSAPRQTRTADLAVNSRTLYLLSYWGILIGNFQSIYIVFYRRNFINQHIPKHKMANWIRLNDIIPFGATLISLYLFIAFFSFSAAYFISAIICIIALIIWWAGKIELGQSFAWLPKAKKLVTTGIYSWIRHPIYIGICLMLVSWSFLLNYMPLYIFTLLTIIFSVLRARAEEEVLLKKFGKDYLNYRRKTFL